MGIDLGKHILSPLNIWNTFSDMGSYIMELTLTLYHIFKAWFNDGYTGLVMYLTGAYQHTPVRFGEWSILTWPSRHENPSQNIDETSLCRTKVATPSHPCGVRI